MTKSVFSRRTFLQTTAAAAGATLFASKAIRLDAEHSYSASAVSAPSDRVRFGIVGVGMEGTGVLATAVTAGLRVRGSGRSLRGRHTLAARLSASRSAPRAATRSCSMPRTSMRSSWPCRTTGTSRWWWMRWPLAKTSTARSRCRTIRPTGVAMVAAAKKTDRIVQIGAQRTSSVICAKAKELYEKGAIGELNLIECTYGTQRSDWRVGVSAARRISRRKIWTGIHGRAPRRRRRSIRSHLRAGGAGRSTDRRCRRPDGASDQRHAVLLGINEVPKRVSAFGGIYRWKDGRNMPDVHAGAV